MAEYVEKAAFREHLDSVYPFTSDGQRDPKYDFAKTVFLSELAVYPAADVAPVLHGHKITHNRPIAGYWASGLLDGGINGMEGRVWVMPIMDNPVDYCSECGKRLDDTFQNYCPNCGAKLDGE